MVVLAAAAAVSGIVAAGYVSQTVSVIVVGILITLAAFGWPYVLGVPAKKSQSAAIAFSALAATGGVVTAAAGEQMAGLAPAVALGIGAVFLIQLIRGTGQSHRLESTLGAGVGVFMVSLGAGWVAADRLEAGTPGLTLIAGISVLIALGTVLLPLPDRITAPLGAVLAMLAASFSAVFLTEVPALPAAVIGAVCGAVVVSARRLLISRESPLSIPAGLAAAVAPVLAIGSLVYFLGKLLLS